MYQFNQYLSFEIKLSHIPNINHGYVRSLGRTFKSSAAKNFENAIMQALMLEKRYLPQIKNIDEKIFRVIFVEKNPKFITKKNTLSKCKGDADRYLKFAIDAVAKQTGFNDSQIVSIACEQVQSEDDHYYLAVFLSYGDFKAEKSES